MSKLTLFAIEEKIKQHEQGLNDLKAQLVEAKLEYTDHQLAKELHGILCRWKHTDGCGWHYEMKDKKDDWTGHAHTEYLRKAQKLIHSCEQEGVSVERAIELFKMVKGV